MADCPGSGVVVDRYRWWRHWWGECPVCLKLHEIEPVEPAGLEPRWRIVDHQEAS